MLEALKLDPNMLPNIRRISFHRRNPTIKDTTINGMTNRTYQRHGVQRDGTDDHRDDQRDDP